MGIVIPNPGQWLLPELQDIGRTLQTTLQLPPDATIGHGLTLQPTSDGFLIWLPSGAVLQLPDFCSVKIAGWHLCYAFSNIFTDVVLPNLHSRAFGLNHV